ncbi:MAG: amino acid transporter, partial [Syntrophales bacterium]
MNSDDSGHKIKFAGKLRRRLIGPPRDIHEPSIFHRISLIPVLAWIGLGADGLSSSSYGPEEAFKALGPHTYLAV